jgi:transposase
MTGPPCTHTDLIAASITNMRSGFNSLATKVKVVPEKNSYGGHPYLQGRRGDLLKALYWSDDGLCLFAKRCYRKEQ